MLCLVLVWPGPSVAAAIGTVAPHKPTLPTSEMRVFGRDYRKIDGTWHLISGNRASPVLDGLISVVFDQSASDTEIQEWLNATGLKIRRSNSAGVHDLRLPHSIDPVAVLSMCEESTIVSRASPNVRGQWTSGPSDEYYQYNNWWRQWNLHRGQTQVEDAWEIETGDTTVVIAVLDTGVELEHDDLKGNLWKNWGETAGDGIDNDGNGFVDDRDGFRFSRQVPDTCCAQNSGDGDVAAYDPHGVHVTGIISAQTNNDSTGIAGIAGGWYDDSWQAGDRGTGCLVMPLSVELDSSAIDDAICYAADNGASVINMSFAIDSTACLRRAINYADSLGVIMVAATGNGSTAVDFPARDSKVLAVGAVKRSGVKAYYSNFGNAIDVVAPSGPCVYHYNKVDCDDDHADSNHTYLWSTGDSSPDGYDFFSGTSAAAPQVSALAGLILSLRPGLDPEDVREIIRYSADDQVGDSADSLGFDIYYGYGRINAYKALIMARGGGEINHDVTFWYDVEFDRDLVINSGATVAFKPGVAVTFTASSDSANLGTDSTRCELIVKNGTLKAISSASDSAVVFKASSGGAGEWYGIRFTESASAGELKYCVIEDAYKAISVDATVSSLVAEHDTIDGTTVQGIYCEYADNNTYIGHNTLKNCGAASIELRDCDGVTVEYNNISDATAYGIKVVDDNGSTISHNTVTGTAGHYSIRGIYYENSEGTFDISHNTLDKCRTRGIHLDDVAHDSSTISYNKIDDVSALSTVSGMEFYNAGPLVRNNRLEDQKYGASIKGNSYVPDFGDTSVSDGENCFENIQTNNICSKSTLTVKAEKNWREETLFAPCSGTVDWIPVLASCPDSTPSKWIQPRKGETVVHTDALYQSWPNPANPFVNISYSIAVEGQVSVRIYNLKGQLVRTVVNSYQKPGVHEVLWDGTNENGSPVSAGVYFYRIDSIGFADTKKLIILK
jgi:parallel beta-helix repeat protein